MELLENIFDENINKFSLDAESSSSAKVFDEIENCLLGSFDKNGKYVIPDEICKELVALKKVYLYAFGEVIFCESEKEFSTLKNIQFLVKIQEKEKNMIAKLYITQDVKRVNGYIKKTAITEIATYENINSPSFVNDCFQKFNIFSKNEDGFQKKEKTESDPVLILRRERLLGEKKLKLDKEDEKFKGLLEKKLQLLSKYKFGKAIINQYNLELEKAKSKLDQNKKGYYRNLNALLDKVVSENKEKLLMEPVFVSKWRSLNAGFTDSIFKVEVVENKENYKNDKKNIIFEVKEDKKPQNNRYYIGGGGFTRPNRPQQPIKVEKVDIVDVKEKDDKNEFLNDEKVEINECLKDAKNEVIKVQKDNIEENKNEKPDNKENKPEKYEEEENVF